ncbi:hypothetical protein AKJ16_DCAP25789 [Drosera capensis]
MRVRKEYTVTSSSTSTSRSIKSPISTAAATTGSNPHLKKPLASTLTIITKLQLRRHRSSRFIFAAGAPINLPLYSATASSFRHPRWVVCVLKL